MVTHGSGHGVPIPHRRDPSAVYGYGRRVATGLMRWSATVRVSHPASSPALARATSSSGAEKVAEKQKRTPRSEEHTSELQSLMRTSYAVFRLKKRKQLDTTFTNTTICKR